MYYTFSANVETLLQENAVFLGVFRRHLGDVVLTTFALMKKPISFLLTVALSATMMRYSILYGLNVAQTDIHTMNVCEFPILSMLPLCTTPPAHTPPLTHADFPALIAIQHRALDELYLNSAIGLDLVLNIKHAELAARDLVIIVKSSDLSSKDALADVLTGFLSDARLAARDLQVFTSKLYGILDR